MYTLHNLASLSCCFTCWLWPSSVKVQTQSHTLILHPHIEGSRPEWCISSMIYSRDTPFWSGTLDILNTNLYPQTQTNLRQQTQTNTNLHQQTQANTNLHQQTQTNTNLHQQTQTQTHTHIHTHDLFVSLCLWTEMLVVHIFLKLFSFYLCVCQSQPMYDNTKAHYWLVLLIWWRHSICINKTTPPHTNKHNTPLHGCPAVFPADCWQWPPCAEAERCSARTCVCTWRCWPAGVLPRPALSQGSLPTPEPAVATLTAARPAPSGTLPGGGSVQQGTKEWQLPVFCGLAVGEFKDFPKEWNNTHFSTPTCTHKHIWTHIHTQPLQHTHVHANAQTCTHANTHTQTHTESNTHTHTHTQINTHTYTRRGKHALAHTHLFSPHLHFHPEVCGIAQGLRSTQQWCSWHLWHAAAFQSAHLLLFSALLAQRQGHPEAVQLLAGGCLWRRKGRPSAAHTPAAGSSPNSN